MRPLAEGYNLQDLISLAYCWRIPSWNHLTSVTWFVFPCFSAVTMPRSDNAATTRCVFKRDRPDSFEMNFCKQVPPCMDNTSTTVLSSGLSVFKTMDVFPFPLLLAA